MKLIARSARAVMVKLVRDGDRVCSSDLSLLRGGFTGRNLDASRIVPIGVCRGGNETHRALGEGGDGQTGVDAKISCHYRSIADVHVFVAEDAMARVDYSVSGGIGDYATSDAVRSEE